MQKNEMAMEQSALQRQMSHNVTQISFYFLTLRACE